MYFMVIIPSFISFESSRLQGSDANSELLLTFCLVMAVTVHLYHSLILLIILLF